jgi:hypothetical protein
MIGELAQGRKAEPEKSEDSGSKPPCPIWGVRREFMDSGGDIEMRCSDESRHRVVAEVLPLEEGGEEQYPIVGKLINSTKWPEKDRSLAAGRR